MGDPCFITFSLLDCRDVQSDCRHCVSVWVFFRGIHGCAVPRGLLWHCLWSWYHCWRYRVRSSSALSHTHTHADFSQHRMLVIAIAPQSGPYYCSGGSVFSVNKCQLYPLLISTSRLVYATKRAATYGYIDHTSGLSNDRVFLVSGLFDYTVRQGIYAELCI